MLVTSLNLIVLKSLDAAELVKFYEQLGLKFETQQHGAAPAHHSASLGEITLEIYPAGSITTRTTNARLGFSTEKIKRVVETAEKAGAKILSEPTESPSGTRAVVADPDGNKIEFVQKDL